ncbi:melanoma-associated antigen 1-like [Hipposideros larvatus]
MAPFPATKSLAGGRSRVGFMYALNSPANCVSRCAESLVGIECKQGMRWKYPETQLQFQFRGVNKEAEEDHQDPREIEDQFGEQVFEAEESPSSSPSSSSSSPFSLFSDSPEEVSAAVTPSPPHSPQSSCPSPSAMEDIPWSQSEDEGSSSQEEEGPSTAEVRAGATSSLNDMLRLKMGRLVRFLLLKYDAKDVTTKAEILISVIGEHQDHFPEIFSRATECLLLLFGVDVKEVDPSDHTYILGTALGLTYDEKECMPKTGLLVLLLCVIVMDGGSASEERVWKVLNDRQVCDGMEHYIYGEPRELITKVWVEEQYLEYRQVTDSDPARYEFLWGPRAHAETTKLKALQFLFKHIEVVPHQQVVGFLVYRCKHGLKYSLISVPLKVYRQLGPPGQKSQGIFSHRKQYAATGVTRQGLGSTEKPISA